MLRETNKKVINPHPYNHEWKPLGHAHPGFCCDVNICPHAQYSRGPYEESWNGLWGWKEEDGVSAATISILSYDLHPYASLSVLSIETYSNFKKITFGFPNLANAHNFMEP